MREEKVLKGFILNEITSRPITNETLRRLGVKVPLKPESDSQFCPKCGEKL